MSKLNVAYKKKDENLKGTDSTRGFIWFPERTGYACEVWSQNKNHNCYANLCIAVMDTEKNMVKKELHCHTRSPRSQKCSDREGVF